MLVFGLNVGSLSKIDLDALAHNCFAIEDLADPNRGLLVKKGDYDAPEGFERGP